MMIEIENRGAVDFANNWSIGGRTCHVEMKQHFLRELKEAGILECKWDRDDKMTSDIHTKNLARPTFEKHAHRLVGYNEYMEANEVPNYLEEESRNHEGRV